jgi:hypothetical protein
MATKKVGRPPKPQRLKRSRRVHLLLTAEEFKALKVYARRQQMTASEVMRKCLRSLLDEQPVKRGAV